MKRPMEWPELPAGTDKVDQSALIKALGAPTKTPSRCRRLEHDYTGSEAVLNEWGQVVGTTPVCVKCGVRFIDEAAWM